jgi:HEAT repeat protein
MVDKYRVQFQSAVVEALAQMGEAAMAPLIRALGDRDPDRRPLAATALGVIGDALATEPLIEALKDEDWRVRDKAAVSLGQLGDARAVEPLIEAFREGRDWNVQIRRGAAVAATLALAQIGEPAVEALTRALQDQDQRVRTGAREALQLIERKKSV